MVDGDEPQFARQLHAGPVGQLVGVQPTPQTGGRPGQQDRARLVGVKGPLLAEHVDPRGMRGGGGEHRSGDEFDVGGWVVGVLQRYDVRAQISGLVGELPSNR